MRFSKENPESVIPIARFPTTAASRNPELAEEALELAEPQENNFVEDVVVHWQEKLFSAHEFEYYGNSDNCVTTLQKKYHQDIEFIKRCVNFIYFIIQPNDSFYPTQHIIKVTISQ